MAIRLGLYVAVAFVSHHLTALGRFRWFQRRRLLHSCTTGT